MDMPFRMQSSRGMKPAGITKNDMVAFFSEAFGNAECGTGASLAIAQKIFFVRNADVRVELYPKLRMGEEVRAFLGANAVHCERNYEIEHIHVIGRRKIPYSDSNLPFFSDFIDTELKARGLSKIDIRGNDDMCRFSKVVSVYDKRFFSAGTFDRKKFLSEALEAADAVAKVQKDIIGTFNTAREKRISFYRSLCASND